MRPRFSIADVNAALAATGVLERLLPDLIGCSHENARRGEWWADSTRDGGPGDSLVVVTKGAKRGIWCHHGGGQIGGDALGLIAYAKHLPMKDAYAFALDWLGGRVPTLSDEDIRRRALAAKRAAVDAERQAKANRVLARRIWFRELQDQILDTPVEGYLAGRGISLRKLSTHWNHVPGCLKFAPALDHPQLGRKLPAMVACYVNLAGELVAIHRTYLVQRDGDRWDRVREEHEGRDRVGKPIKGKIVLGPTTGCCIRLWAGERVDPRTGEIKRGVPWSRAPENSEITLTEGIENGFALASVMPARRIGATGSLAGLANVELPACFARVVLAHDRDDGNGAARLGRERAVAAHRTAGRECLPVGPPPGIQDWNDMLRRAAT